MKRADKNSNAKATCNSTHLPGSTVKETKFDEAESNSGKHEAAEDCVMLKESTNESESTSYHGSVETKLKKGNRGLKKNPRKKSREVYEMGVPEVSIAAERDQYLEMKLAKKLKVKGGKLRGMDDCLNKILDGSSSEEEVLSYKIPSKKGGSVNAKATNVSKPVDPCEKEAVTMIVPALVPEKRTNEKYIAPHLRARAGNEPEEHTQIRRRIRGKKDKL